MLASIRGRVRPLTSILGKFLRGLAYIVVAFILPIEAFLFAGQRSTDLQTAGLAFASTLWTAIWASPPLALGGVAALCLLAHDGYKRYYMRNRFQRSIDLFNEYTQIYEQSFEEEIQPLLDKELSEAEYDLLVKSINLVLATMCTMVASSFSEITADKCFATLKVYDEATGKIETRTRDANQHGKRKKADDRLPNFDYKSNTAFEKIIDDGAEAYVSNWLPLLGLIGRYTNQNSTWFKHYGATAVVPVALVTDGRQRTVGFICVDNFAGRFPKKLSPALLQSYVGTAHKLLDILGKTRKG